MHAKYTISLLREFINDQRQKISRKHSTVCSDEIIDKFLKLHCLIFIVWNDPETIKYFAILFMEPTSGNNFVFSPVPEMSSLLKRTSWFAKQWYKVTWTSVWVFACNGMQQNVLMPPRPSTDHRFLHGHLLCNSNQIKSIVFVN